MEGEGLVHPPLSRLVRHPFPLPTPLPPLPPAAGRQKDIPDSRAFSSETAVCENLKVLRGTAPPRSSRGRPATAGGTRCEGTGGRVVQRCSPSLTPASHCAPLCCNGGSRSAAPIVAPPIVGPFCHVRDTVITARRFRAGSCLVTGGRARAASLISLSAISWA